jgi:hypothetical protein
MRPLLAPLDSARPAGIVAVSATGVRAVDWRDGRAEDVVTMAFDDESGEWRRMKGPASSNPAQSMQMASQRDLFERRLREHRKRYVSGCASELVEAAEARGWERLLLAGMPELIRALSAETSGRVPTLEGGAIPRAEISAQDLATALAPALDQARDEDHRQKAALVRDAALSTQGTATLGLDDTLAALAEGRVHELLLDTQREVSGVVSPDGRLARRGQVPPGVAPGTLQAEPHLIERMIERALETGAGVVPLAATAADVLDDWDRVAARLRW